MTHSRMIDHGDQQILFCDFSDCTSDEDALQRIAEARQLVHSQPRHSVLSLIDLRGSRFNTTVIQACRQLAADNVPYIVATAVVGVNDLKAMMLKAISKITGRNFHFASGLEDGKNWLLTQRSEVKSDHGGLTAAKTATKHRHGLALPAANTDWP